MYTRFLCTRATKEGENVKPIVIPYPPKVIVQQFLFIEIHMVKVGHLCLSSNFLYNMLYWYNKM
jgi:hypothetical protein